MNRKLSNSWPTTSTRCGRTQRVVHFTAKMPPCARRAFDFVIIGILLILVGLEQVRVCAPTGQAKETMDEPESARTV